MTQAPDADALRRVLDTVFAAPTYRWVERPDLRAMVRRAWRLLRDRLDALAASHPVLRDLLVAALVLVLVAIVIHTVRLVLRTIRPAEDARAAGAALPPARDEAWYRREAERLAAAGRYVEAMQADFVALVLALDAARALRFHPAKTPAEYVAELRGAPERRRAFRELVGTLYGHAFARHPCDAAAWADWRRRSAPEAYAAAG